MSRERNQASSPGCRYGIVPLVASPLEAVPGQTISTGGPVITVDGAGFSYPKGPALDGLTMEIAEGEIVALLGHNGAGKTTAIKLLNGLLSPTRGVIRVLGCDPGDETSGVRRQMAVVTDTLGLSERETPRKALAYHAALYGIDVELTLEYGLTWMSRFGIAEHFDTPIKTFSRGMRQRLALCRALSGNPQILLLDEPTLGMDPVARQDFRAAMNKFRRDGGAVLMSTHDLGEVERLCQKVVVLQQGRVVTSGTTTEFMEPLFRDLDVEVDLVQITHDVLAALEGFGSIRNIAHDYSRITFQAQDRDAIPRAIALIVEAGGRILRVGSASPTLEDAYLTLHSSAAERRFIGTDS